MSQPAARLGDATAHGGVVTSGNPTVLINGQPTAALGDLHVCPMCSPGPHVGGPVVMGAPTVLIGGKPAARVGDTCTCAAPAPDVIVSGSPNVLIGGASAAASPGAAAAAASAHGAAASPGTPGLGATARPLSPWVGVGYVDAAGRPVTGWHYRAEGERQREGQLGTGGQVWADGLAGGGAVEVGLVGVYGVRWAKDEARVGEAVEITARCVGMADGTVATAEVWRDTPRSDGSLTRECVWTDGAEVRGGNVTVASPFEFTWGAGAEARSTGVASTGPAGDAVPPERLEVQNGGSGRANNDRLQGAPTYTAHVVVEGRYRAASQPLRYRDWIEIEALGLDGRPVARAEVLVQFPNGEVRPHVADARGVVRIEDAPPGRIAVRVTLPPDR